MFATRTRLIPSLLRRSLVTRTFRTCSTSRAAVLFADCHCSAASLALGSTALPLPSHPLPSSSSSALMGCDGGSIAGRQELVKTAKRVVSAHSVRSQARSQHNSCALSQQPLRAPVVACAMGNLFNKDALIEYLLAKQSYPHFSHIQSLKDVVTVKLTWSEQASGAAKSAAATAAAAASSAAATPALLDDSTSSSSSAPTGDDAALYCCPIMSLPSNGQNRFVVMQPCGCVISERAVRSVGVGKGMETCMVCSKELAKDTPTSPTHVAAVEGAEAAAASAAVTAAAPAEATAASPYHHPSYLTLFPGPEETLYLRAIQADKLKAREAEKAAKKAARKAEKAAAGPVSSGEGVAAGHKRKADSDAVGVAKKAASNGAHAAMVASRTGNALADQVRLITEQAAAAVAEKRKQSAFNSMFLTQEQIANTKFDPISTKPSSLMSQL